MLLSTLRSPDDVPAPGPRSTRPEAIAVPAGAPPRRRPWGAPRAANPAIASFYVLAGLTPAMAWITATAWTGRGYDAFFAGTGYVFAGACCAVALVILLNFGSIVAVAAFRYIGFGLSLLAVVVAVAAGAMLLVGGLERADRTACLVVLAFSALQAPLAAILTRTLLRVRWLDPASSPSEWELPPSRSAVR